MGRAHFEAGHPDKAEDCLARAMQLNPDFKAGETFYQHLLKLHPLAATSSRQASGKKSGGFLKKILKQIGY